MVKTVIRAGNVLGEIPPRFLTGANFDQNHPQNGLLCSPVDRQWKGVLQHRRTAVGVTPAENLRFGRCTFYHLQSQSHHPGNHFRRPHPDVEQIRCRA